MLRKFISLLQKIGWKFAKPIFWRRDMNYSRSSHTTYHNRYHLVWITKYRYKVLQKDIKLSVRELTRKICQTLGVKVISGVLSSNHVHMFVEIPPKLSVSEFMRRVKGATSRKIQSEYPALRARYWGKRFWGRGYFCTTSGNVRTFTELCQTE